MAFHENSPLTDDSYEISYLIFFENREISKNLSSATVVIGALRVNNLTSEQLKHVPIQKLQICCVSWYFGLVGFVALRPKSTAMVIAGRSVHLTTLFPG